MISSSLNFAKKLIYNFDIIILEYDDDENIIGHNTIYDLYQCCERSDCNNKGDPIGRDGNNNCVCECDEKDLLVIIVNIHFKLVVILS